MSSVTGIKRLAIQETKQRAVEFAFFTWDTIITKGLPVAFDPVLHRTSTSCICRQRGWTHHCGCVGAVGKEYGQVLGEISVNNVISAAAQKSKQKNVVPSRASPLFSTLVSGPSRSVAAA